MWLPNFILPVHDHYGDLSETSFSLCSTQYLSNVPIRPIDCVKMHTASEFKGVIPAAGMGGIVPPVGYRPLVHWGERHKTRLDSSFSVVYRTDYLSLLNSVEHPATSGGVEVIFSSCPGHRMLQRGCCCCSQSHTRPPNAPPLHPHCAPTAPPPRPTAAACDGFSNVTDICGDVG